MTEGAALAGPLLSYQGRLADPATGNPKNGTFAMTFRLYDVLSGGGALWTEGPKNVVVTNGLFSALLGDTTALNLAAFDGRDLWLGVQVASDLEATPRIPVAYTPYALYTRSADLLDGQHAAAFAAATHAHAGEQITSGTVADARIAGTIARDAEIMPAVLAADGSGSGLDADALDGQHSTAFATASHTHPTLPIAYAFIGVNGSKYSGTSNVTSSWDAANHWYVITISGYSYFWSDFVTVVTPACGAGISVETNSVSNNLLVAIYNASNSWTQCAFQFVTYH